MGALRVTPATLDDLDTVRAVYAEGRVRQQREGSTIWPEFSDDAIRGEITARRLLLILGEDAVAGVFSVAYKDDAIWGERERGAHVYLHRIVRARAYHGSGIVDVVLEWARAHCRAIGRAGLRMDTWANNAQLIAYYERLGFDLVGTQHIGVDSRLPAHYHGLEFALLEQSCSIDPLSATAPDTAR